MSESMIDHLEKASDLISGAAEVKASVANAKAAVQRLRGRSAKGQIKIDGDVLDIISSICKTMIEHSKVDKALAGNEKMMIESVNQLRQSIDKLLKITLLLDKRVEKLEASAKVNAAARKRKRGKARPGRRQAHAEGT